MINNREEIKIGSYRHMPIESPVDIFFGWSPISKAQDDMSELLAYCIL